MFGKRLILLLNNNGQAVLKEHPAAYPLPDRKTISTKDDPVDFYKTDRVREVNGEEAVIYVQRNSRVNLDDYATGYVSGAEGVQDTVNEPTTNPAPQAPQTAHTATPAKVYGKDGKAPFNLTINRNEETGEYEAKFGVGTEFNKELVEELGEDGLEYMQTLIEEVFDTMKRSAKKKASGYVEDVFDLGE